MSGHSSCLERVCERDELRAVMWGCLLLLKVSQNQLCAGSSWSRSVLRTAGQCCMQRKTSLGMQGRVLSSTAVSSLWSRVLSHCWSVNIFPELVLLGPGDLVRSSWG